MDVSRNNGIVVDINVNGKADGGFAVPGHARYFRERDTLCLPMTGQDDVRVLRGVNRQCRRGVLGCRINGTSQRLAVRPDIRFDIAANGNTQGRFRGGFDNKIVFKHAVAAPNIDRQGNGDFAIGRYRFFRNINDGTPAAGKEVRDGNALVTVIADVESEFDRRIGRSDLAEVEHFR